MGSSDSKSSEKEELKEPWRKFNWNKNELKMKLENFALSNSEIKNVKILVAGEIGAGKSSFINTIFSAFQGRIYSAALVDSTAQSHSCTKQLDAYSIRCGNKVLPFTFKDVMGLEPDALSGSNPEDIVNAIFGHLKNDYKFDQKKPLSFEDQQFNTDPGLSDQTFCLVYIIAANTVQFIDDRVIDKLRIIRHRVSEKKIPQVIVMTKVDEACPLVKQDLKKVYKSMKIRKKMQMCSDRVGVPMCNIFPVKNYHEEMDTDDTIDALILKALEQIVNVADDRLWNSSAAV